MHNHSLEVEHASSRKLHEASFSAGRCTHILNGTSTHAGYAYLPTPVLPPPPPYLGQRSQSQACPLRLDLSVGCDIDITNHHPTGGG